MSYRYPRLSPGLIRLLTLKRSHDGNTFNGILASHSIKQLPPYDALSYTWGTLKSHQRIDIRDDSGNRGWLEITPNLELAMKRLVAPGDSKLVWIDQVCINQQEKKDKSTQVEVMSDIYQAADRVIVYLGEPMLDFNPEPGILRDILHCLAKVDGLVVITDANFHKLGLPSKEAPVWMFLAEVLASPWFERLWTLQSPWFERLWTLQEVVLATNIHLVFGRHILEWELWVSLAHALLNAQLHPFICSQIFSPPRTVAGFSALVHAHLLRDSRARGQIPLAQILEVGRTKKCGLPIDRIYASRGMMSEGARRLIDVDYSKPSYAACLHAFKLIIQGDLSFWVLGSVGSRGQSEDLPSWCPDLDQPPPENPLGTFGPSARYHAGFQLPPNISDFFHFTATRRNIQNLAEVSNTSNSIKILGISIDIIKTVSHLEWRWPQPDEPQVARQTVEWEQACLSIAQETLQSNANVPEEHWRCLIANKSQSHQPCAADLRGHYNEMIQYLNLVADSRIPSPKISGDQISRILNFGLAVDYACKGRRYFSTKDGRIGLGPASCTSGDIVCVFHNAPVPYIVRRADSCGAESDNGREKSYTFIGESYVHGLMNAEAFDLRDAGKATEQKFTIE